MLGGYPHGHLGGAEKNVQIAIGVHVTYSDSHPSVPVLILNPGPHYRAISLLHEQQKGLWKGKSPVGIEGDDGEVETAVAIEIAGRDINRAGQRLEQDLAKSPVALVLQDSYAVVVFDRPASEFQIVAGGFDDVQPSVSVPIRQKATVVAPAYWSLDDRALRETASALVDEGHNAGPVVGDGEHNVGAAVTVKVGDVTPGCARLFQQHLFPRSVRAAPPDPNPANR